MLFEWKESLLKLDEYETDKALEYINKILEKYDFYLVDKVKPHLSKIISKYGVNKVIEVAENIDNYQWLFDNGHSIVTAIEKKLKTLSMPKEEQLKRYIGGILKNRFGQYATKYFMTFMKNEEPSIDDLKHFESIAKSAYAYSEFKNALNFYYD